MDCVYCHKPCLLVPSIKRLTYDLKNIEGNYWLCNSQKCPGEEVSFFTDKRDDIPMVTTIRVRRRGEPLSIVLNWLTKETTVRPWLKDEPLIHFPYIAKFTPKNAMDKIETILTFG
jgi:hypothetical protein